MTETDAAFAPPAEPAQRPLPATQPEAEQTPPPPKVARASFFQSHRGLLRGLTLVVATALSLFGTLGQFYLVDSLQEVADARAKEMRDIETRTETLRSAQAAYFNAQVQGNMLFALNPADKSVNKGVVGDLYHMAIIDRGFPFRSILGELAIAGAIDFKTVNDRYNALRDAATEDYADYAAFMAVGEFERAVLDQAMDLHGKLQERFWSAESEKAKAEAESKARRAMLLAVAGAATCLFLLANLMGVKD